MHSLSDYEIFISKLSIILLNIDTPQFEEDIKKYICNQILASIAWNGGSCSYFCTDKTDDVKKIIEYERELDILVQQGFTPKPLATHSENISALCQLALISGYPSLVRWVRKNLGQRVNDSNHESKLFSVTSGL
jgi:hypothetical protein